jgi:histidinol-phosphate aminotransferase
MEAISRANRYPMEEVRQLKTALAKRLGVTNNQLLITAGSTEVLSLLGQKAGLEKGEILTPWPSFPTLLRFGEACGAVIKKVPLRVDDRLDLDQLFSNISDKTSLIYLCNPNNPTSTEVDAEALRSFCQAVPARITIAVDEAYIEYSQNGVQSSLVPLVNTLPNLVVCRTFSKVYGLAGLRIGFAVAQNDLLQSLRQRHLGWELAAGLAPLVAAQAALADEAFLQMAVAKNAEGRQIVGAAFSDWGVSYAPSATSFIYARDEAFVPEVVQRLRQDNILITKWGTMTDHIRISIGKPAEMNRFVETVQQYLR